MYIIRFFQGGETKLIFENLIFPQRDFVCWWNLHLNMPDYLNAFIPSGNKRLYILNKPAAYRCWFVKYIWPFVTTRHERVKGTKYLWNKKLRNKSLWTGPQKLKNMWKDCEWADFYCIYLFIWGLYFHVKWNMLLKQMTN